MSAHLTHQNLWSKKVLVPLWTIQILLLLFAIAATIFVLASGATGSVIFNMLEYSSIYKLLTILCYSTGFAILGFNIACIAFTINEIIHYSRQRLQPLVYLIMQIIKVTYFLIMFIISLVFIVKDLGEVPYLVVVPAINL